MLTEPVSIHPHQNGEAAGGASVLVHFQKNGYYYSEIM